MFFVMNMSFPEMLIKKYKGDCVVASLNFSLVGLWNSFLKYSIIFFQSG